MWPDHWPGEPSVPCTHDTCNRGNEKIKLKNNKNKNEVSIGCMYSSRWAWVLIGDLCVMMVTNQIKNQY